MYLDASSAKNEKSCIERGMNMAVQLKQIVAKTLGLAVMLYTKQVQWEKINLRYALESLSDEFKLANKYEKEVHITIKYFLPEFVMWSEQLIYAIRNLVDNAVKYSSNVAEIKIVACQKGKYILLTVTDCGKGIAKKDVAHIFEEYWRETEEKKIEGYGLGLASVKKIVQRHKGKISVDSELGIGSTFTIKIREYGKKNKTFICRR